MSLCTFLKLFKRSTSQGKRTSPALSVEQLADRIALSTYSVLTLQDSGPGSLRQAILNVDTDSGPDVINFSVAGTIRLTSGALPAVTNSVTIDGTTAPGFAGAPVVAIDSNHFAGLQFNAGSAGSTLRSLSLMNASGAGVTFNGVGTMLVAGNYVGLGLDGSTVAGNAGNGLEFDASSGNTIGGTTAQDRNVISGNLNNGIALSASSNNQIIGNLIGTDVTGTVARGNAINGVLVTARASGNVIGGLPGNVISGNGASGVAITGQATQNTVSGNLIGLTAAGNAALGNRLDGVQILGADHNLIGQNNPVTGVTYNNANNISIQPVTAWQGIRAGDASGQYLITGTSNSNGLLFNGTMAGVGTSYSVNYPNAAATSVYGPDNLGQGKVRLVGTYRNADALTASVTVNGFLFEGATADLSQGANYRTIDYPGAKFNYVHSTMGGLAVGNYDSPVAHGTYNLPLGPGHAFLYDVAHGTFVTDIAYPNALSNTAYGIWYNGGTSYTICGGYSLSPVNNFDDQTRAIGHAYLVDYDSATGNFTNWATFDYPYGNNFITHFEGLSSVEKGVYTLNADSLQGGSTNPTQGSWVSVRRNADGSFGQATWVNLNYPGFDPTTHITSSNSVSGNQVVGVVLGPQSGVSFQATINVGFQLSNVISGNGANGINLIAANNNQIAMNYVGTDASGTVALGNAINGILVTAGASSNLIGGDATGGNDPTNNVFVRPPEGNLISGNGSDGVFINGQATQNTLSGNFIGTAASGSAALGNGQDGVAIEDANGNALIGCTFQQDPFVFYNVISGNGANGLRVTNANNTTVQANFFGVGADNTTPVGNGLNGLVFEGSSANTVMGGPIPLGNVDSANKQNGLVVRDTVSGFVTYNTFCGLAAFKTNTNLGNGLDGMLITSTGSNILIRTNVITENGNDGIEITGAASGVRVAGNIIGLDTIGNLPMGNKNNGVEVGGAASGIIIGGPQPTFNIIPRNAISANGGNGVAITGNAHDTQVSYGYIGTDLTGKKALGNARAGVFLGSGTQRIAVGSLDPNLLTVISGNLGDGIAMNGSSGNTVVGSFIGTDSAGVLPLPNGGNGVFISNGFENVIGTTAPVTANTPANLIAFNGANGVLVVSGNRNGIHENSIYGNTLLGINLAPGANMNQAAPALASVRTLVLGIQVFGSVTGTPNTTFTVEIFANATDGSSGRYFLGAQTVTTNASGFGTFSFSAPRAPNGARVITATATDPMNNTSPFRQANPVHFFAISGPPGRVLVYKMDNTLVADFAPYGNSYTGPVTVAVGDVTGDGIDDIVTGAAVGNADVRVYDGAAFARGTFNPANSDASMIAHWFPYALNINVGANVAVGDVEGNGFADIVTGADMGNPDVRVYRGRDIAGRTFDPNGASLVAQWFPYGLNFNVGANVAVGDVTGDGFAEVVTGATAGNSDVRVYSGKDIATGHFDPQGTSLLAQFFPYAKGFNVGAFVTVGDTTGSGFGDVITGASAGNPDVRVYRGQDIANGTFNNANPEASLRDQFFAYGLSQNTGVAVASADFANDGQFDILTEPSVGPPLYRVVKGNATGVEPPALIEGMPSDLQGSSTFVGA